MKELPPRLPSERQRRFVDSYLVCLNASKAALEAGYSPRTAELQGAQLLKKPAIRALLQERAASMRERTGITIQQLTDEYAPVAFADMRHYLSFGPKGEVVLDWSHMPKEASKAIAEITQEEYMKGRGEGAQLVRRTRFKLHSKISALDSLSARLWPVPKAEPERPAAITVRVLYEDEKGKSGVEVKVE